MLSLKQKYMQHESIYLLLCSYMKNTLAIKRIDFFVPKSIASPCLFLSFIFQGCSQAMRVEEDCLQKVSLLNINYFSYYTLEMKVPQSTVNFLYPTKLCQLYLISFFSNEYHLYLIGSILSHIMPNIPRQNIQLCLQDHKRIKNCRPELKFHN